jgi:hypothetical protein
LEVNEEELGEGMGLLRLVRGSLVGLELVVLAAGTKPSAGQGSNSLRAINQPVGKLVRALVGLRKLERAVLSGVRGVTVLSVNELEWLVPARTVNSHG